MTDILDLIDNAVQDYETSCDAMRWSPDPTLGDAGPLIEAMQSMAENARIWIGEQEITNMVVPGSLRVHYDTTPLLDASPTVTYSLTTPDGVLSYTESAGFAAFDGDSGRAEWFEWSADPPIDYDAAWWTPEWSAADAAAYERINGLRDVSGTITGYWSPPPVNVHPIMDDICQWLAANRIDYRSVPIEAVPAIFDNRIFCPVYVRSQAGKLWVDRRSDSVRTRMVRARLRVPPPPVLKPWLAAGSLLPVLVWAKGRLARRRMHTSYSARLRSRRRRNRR